MTFLLDAVLGAFIQVPINLDKGLVLDAIGKMLLVAVGCGVVLLRGERLADIGLKWPKSWMRTLIIGAGLAAIVFSAMYISERAGFRRDLSKFRVSARVPESSRNRDPGTLGILWDCWFSRQGAVFDW